jgi:cytochrome c oxidase assembly factor CtaG
MTTGQLLEAAWDPSPSILIGCALLLGLYLLVSRGRPLRSVLVFLLGDLTLLFALISPLDELGDTYLFSAHMLQHLLLVLLVPPLLIAGLPETPLRSALQREGIRRLERILSRPQVAWFLGIGTLWIWHVPLLYDATLASEAIHVFEHLTFLVTGVIFWWPIFTPLQDHRYGTSTAIAYLGVGALANTALGVLLTFAPAGFYPYYTHPRDPYHALSLIRNGWGLDAADDQQLGGVFMWVLGGLVFLVALMIELGRWLHVPSLEPSSPPESGIPKEKPGLDEKGGHKRV